MESAAEYIYVAPELPQELPAPQHIDTTNYDVLVRDNAGEYHLTTKYELDKSKFQGCEVKYMFQFARGGALKALKQVWSCTVLYCGLIAMANLQTDCELVVHSTATT